MFDRVRGTDTILADLFICSTCQAITNGAAYEQLATKKIVDVQHSDFYALSPEDLEKTKAEIEASQGLFDALAKSAPFRSSDTFLDFGAGKGNVAIKAASLFQRSIVCEWDTRCLERTLAAIGRPASLEVARDLKAVKGPVDVLFMWHVLEHLPYPSSFWRQHRHRLAEDATIFLQIPLFRAQHVVHSHYIFWTEKSLTRWADVLDAKPVHFGYDVENGFLSMIAKRHGWPS
jgi:2-polyprenyl-3-methyl-5-hydroxy-6-metoxy-1,4-benzoquinol methylase